MSTDMTDFEGHFKKEGFELMGAVFEVHREIGGGLAEEVYQESLEVELEMRGIPFVSKEVISIFYKGRELRRKYVPDLVVNEGMVVELKAVATLLSEHEAQLLNYMRLSRMRVGYLINLAPLKTVEWKRFIL
jgi:GxxExxY protein